MDLSFIGTEDLVEELHRRSEQGLVFVENPNRDTQPVDYTTYHWGSPTFLALATKRLHQRFKYLPDPDANDDSNDSNANTNTQTDCQDDTPTPPS
jgi:hypothetical protein